MWKNYTVHDEKWARRQERVGGAVVFGSQRKIAFPSWGLRYKKGRKKNWERKYKFHVYNMYVTKK